MAPTKTKEESWELAPLEDEVGTKLAERITKCTHVEVAESGDPRDAALAIVSRILDTTTLEESNEVFTGGTTSSRELADEGAVVQLRSMTIRASDFPDPDTADEKGRGAKRGWYATYDAVNTETGETVIVSSSSKTVMAQFVAADAAGLVPATGRFVKGSKTERGFEPIHFEFNTA